MKNDIKLSETVVVSLNSILPISVTRTELNFGLLMLREEGGVGGGGWGAMNPPKPADEFGRRAGQGWVGGRVGECNESSKTCR